MAPVADVSPAVDLKSSKAKGSIHDRLGTRSADADADVSLDRTLPEAGKPEQFFLWGCELSRSKDTVVLQLDGDSDDRHLLHLKSAVLGVDAVAGERNVVELKTRDFEGKELRHYLTSLTLGLSDCCKLDLPLTWTKEREIVLKLVMGSGPVSISGNHLVAEDAEEAAESEVDPDYVPDDSTADDTGMDTDGDTDAEEAAEEGVDSDLLKDLEKDAKDHDIQAEGKRKR